MGTRKLLVETNCVFCGAEINQVLKAGRPKRFCQKKCADRFYQAQRNEKNRTPRPCLICRIEFVPHSLRVKYCSDSCRVLANRQMSRDSWSRYKDSRPATKVWICGWCNNELVVPIDYTGTNKYHDECKQESIRARNRAKNVRRRGYRADARMRINEIAERDDFKCYLCGEDVDMSLPRRSKFGATIDHVIPLSRGGSDDVTNLRLTHWHCNCRKSDKFVEDFIV